MTEPNLNDAHAYKKLPDPMLHRTKNDPDGRQDHRSYAEAEIARRLRFWPKVVAIATIITAIITAASFIYNTIKTQSTPPITQSENQKLIMKQTNVLDETSPQKTSMKQEPSK